MSSRIFVMPEHLDWKQAYVAAIFERNPERILRLIEDARGKLGRRLRQLTVQGTVPCEEAEAIHDASYLLQALQSSLPYRG